MKKKKITPEMIESLSEYIGIINEISTGKKYKGEWNYTYKDNQMIINKGKKLSWKEVLKIVRDEMIRFEKEDK